MACSSESPGAIEAVTGETAATSFVFGLSPAFAVRLLVALQLGQLPAAGRLGAVGYAVNVIGLGLFGGAAFTLNMALFYVDDSVGEDLAAATRLSLLGSALVFAAGCVLFGIAMLRARRYPRCRSGRTPRSCRCSRSPGRCRSRG